MTDLENDVKDLWNELLGKWDEQEDFTWMKRCELFTAYITSMDDDIFELNIHLNDDRLEDEDPILSSVLEGRDIVTASKSADKQLFEFVRAGTTVLAPLVDEVRFVQMMSDPEGKLYGLTEEGVLYRYESMYTENGNIDGWRPMSMKAMRP